LVLTLSIDLDLTNRTEARQIDAYPRPEAPFSTSGAAWQIQRQGRTPMSKFTVTRTLKSPRDKVWQVLTQPGHFEGWLPAKPGTAVLDVRTGGSWQATVVSAEGAEIALTGRYDEVSEPDRLVMTVPGDALTAITLTTAQDDTTQIAYAFDVDDSMHDLVTESVDDVLGRISAVLAGIA
jgi:uncharacterized protein YndB with AHSA1/START domain